MIALEIGNEDHEERLDTVEKEVNGIQTWIII